MRKVAEAWVQIPSKRAPPRQNDMKNLFKPSDPGDWPLRGSLSESRHCIENEPPTRPGDGLPGKVFGSFSSETSRRTGYRLCLRIPDHSHPIAPLRLSRPHRPLRPRRWPDGGEDEELLPSVEPLTVEWVSDAERESKMPLSRRVTHQARKHGAPMMGYAAATG